MLCKMLMCMCVFFLGGGQSLVCATFEEGIDEDFEEFPVERPEAYVLPLSYEEDAPLLVVPVPESFKVAFNGSSFPDVLFLELTPSYTPYRSERITIGQATDMVDAHLFIKNFKSVIEESQLLDSYFNYTSSIRCGWERGVKVGFYITEHPWVNLHQIGIEAPQYMEILKVKTVQGADRIWVIQYAIRYDPQTITDAQHMEIIDKIQAFFKSCRVSSNVTALPI